MKRILTGDRPSGRLHLGHYVGSLQSRLTLESSHQQFVMIADVQALTDNFDNPTKITQSVIEVAKDYLAVGLSPEKTTFLIQSQIPEIAELTIYYMNLVNIGRLERNPTVKAEIKQKNFGEGLPAGFLCYPISQAADITIFKAELVPVGEDQLPMIEQTNEIVRKFNRIYSTDCLKECKAHLSHEARLIGIDGKAKASKSLANTIFLGDSSDEIKQKTFSMYTDPDHIKVSDPGKVEGNVVFAYLDAFYEDKTELTELKAHYARGGLGDMVLKKKLNQCLQDMLTPIRERRAALDDNAVRDILAAGTKKARQVATETIEEVRAAIGLDYFHL